MHSKTLTVVLAGGLGRRLLPLTTHRAKCAVPFGGKYRIIDFCLANCLLSGLRQVLVLTQYKSHSLHKHLRDGWSVFNPELGEYITVVPPQMRVGEGWYQGSADAIYQNKYLLERSSAENVLVLSADHIYRMDYGAMLKAHRKSGAAVSVAVRATEAGSDDAPTGRIEADGDGRITRWLVEPAAGDQGSLESADAAMGIYLFDKALLLQALEADREREDSTRDFIKDVLPRLVEGHRVMAYRFGGTAGRVNADRYWREVGTLDAYYAANMDLLEAHPGLNLYQEDWPVRSYQQQTPPARTVPGESGSEGISINSIMAGGAVIAGGSVQRSILFPKVFVGDEAVVEESILFDGVQVGGGARLRRCIIDKHTRVPAGVRIGYDTALDRERFTVSDKGIVVVPKGYRFAEE